MMVTSYFILLLLVCFSRGRNIVEDKDTDRNDAVATMKMNINSIKSDIKTLNHYLDGPSTLSSSKDSGENNVNEKQEDHGDYKEKLSDKEIAETSNEELINQIEGVAPEHFEGDMILDNKQSYEMIKGKDIHNSVINNVAKYWGPMGGPRIPYTVDSRLNAGTVISNAIKDFTDKTCIRWVPKTANDRDYVKFFSDRGCYSLVGKKSGGGMQPISLQNNDRNGYGCVHKGVAIHEMMHALGFFHEHSRSDRDTYVNIKFSNIVKGMEYNFNKSPTRNFVDYDYGSVMQYGATAFGIRPAGARQPATTIVALDLAKLQREGGRLGQRGGMSKLNIDALNALYCNGGTTKTTVKPATTVKPVNPGPATVNAKFCVAVTGPGLCQYCLIRSMCPDACTQGATDTRTKCPTWANSGYCVTGRYQTFMWARCRKSCLPKVANIRC